MLTSKLSTHRFQSKPSSRKFFRLRRHFLRCGVNNRNVSLSTNVQSQQLIRIFVLEVEMGKSSLQSFLAYCGTDVHILIRHAKIGKRKSGGPSTKKSPGSAKCWRLCLSKWKSYLWSTLRCNCWDIVLLLIFERFKIKVWCILDESIWT